MVKVEILETMGSYKKGDIAEIDDIDVWKKIAPKSSWKLAEQSSGQPSDDGQEMAMGDVKAFEGLIMENGVDYNIVLLTHHVKKFTYDKDGDEGTFDRYELQVEHEGKQTTVRVPASVVSTMWDKVKRNDAVPVADKRPRFIISKSGTGIKTKYNVNFIGVGK